MYAWSRVINALAMSSAVFPAYLLAFVLSLWTCEKGAVLLNLKFGGALWPAVAHLTLTQALTNGLAVVAERIAAGLAGDPRLSQTGISIVDVHVAAIRPETDVERALQTPTREGIQQEADRATFERRALAVERERAQQPSVVVAHGAARRPASVVA